MEDLLQKRSRLYAIADYESCLTNNIDILNFATAFFEGGGVNIQYRDKVSESSEVLKNAQSLKEISSVYNGCLIVNDHIQIATELELALHVGWDTPEVHFKGAFGRSTHNPEEINRALVEKPKASYLGFGAVFPSATKSEIEVNTKYLDFLFSKWFLDIVFIGGITEKNISQLPVGERYYYAIISDFFSTGNQPADVEKYTRRLNEKISAFT